MKILVRRQFHEEEQTLGYMVVFNERNGIEFTCCTLELPWKDNARQISCIPTGTYKAIRRTSPKYGEHIHILGVPDRSYILIHQANYVRQLRGCIAVGRKHIDIDGDGKRDVTSSRDTMKDIMSLVPKEGEFEIVVEDV